MENNITSKIALFLTLFSVSTSHCIFSRLAPTALNASRITKIAAGAFGVGAAGYLYTCNADNNSSRKIHHVEPYKQTRDKRFIKKLAAKEFGNFGDWSLDKCNETKTSESEIYQIYVACENNKPVGFIFWSFTPTRLIQHKDSSTQELKKNSGDGFIHHLAIGEEHRKKGHAQALIKKVIEQAQEQGVTKIILFTTYDRMAAQYLYEKIGFIKITSETEYVMAYQYQLNVT